MKERRKTGKRKRERDEVRETRRGGGEKEKRKEKESEKGILIEQEEAYSRKQEDRIARQ